MSDRHIPLPSAPNLRDLGGLPAAGTRVKPGLVFRSGSLSDLTDADLPVFESLRVRTVFDLRTAREQQAQPDRLPGGVARRGLDVLPDSSRVCLHV